MGVETVMSIASGVKLTQLDNGLTVLTKEMHTAPVVTVWALYKVGSRNEREGITGCSHWVEHMLFKGGKKFKKGDIFKHVARVGGYNNGFTDNDLTAYFETLPASEVDLGLEIEADRMANALFDPKETESERTVIISEREGAENSPEFLLLEQMMAAAFQVHPYRWQVIGHKRDLRNMTRDDLYQYYQIYYGPNNAILLIVGDFSTDEMLKKAENLFGSIVSGAIPPPVTEVEPPQQEERRVSVRRPGTTAYLQAGFHVPAVGHPDIPALMTLDTILSGAKTISFQGGAWMGRSSRLYRALVDAGLASSVQSMLPHSHDPSLFFFLATVRTGVDPQRVEQALSAELHKICSEPPSSSEMKKALRQTKAQLAYSADGVSAQAFVLGGFASVASHDYLDRLVEDLPKVRPEDVQRVAATYLKPNNCTVGQFIPTEGTTTGNSGAGPPRRAFHFTPITHDSGGNTGRTMDIQRFPLSGGGVLLVCPNHNTPTAVIRASLAAGGVRETDEQAGLASLTSRLVMRGTARHSHQEIAESVESIGASLSFASALEEAHAGAKCMARDISRLLEVLAECWREPSFPSEEVEKVRSETLTGIQQERDDTRTVAEQTFRRLLYPANHPYGRNRLGEEDTVRAINRQSIAEFHHTNFSPADLILVAVGDIEPQAVLEATEKVFAGWKKDESREPNIPALAVSNELRRRNVSMMHKSQADIALGFPALTRSNPAYYAADLACLIVGRLGLMGRLGKNVRDEQGLAYYVFSRLHAWKYGGHWLVQAGVNPANLKRARESIWEEIKKLAKEPVSTDELAEAKSSQIGSLALRLETNDGIAAVLHQIEYHGLGLDYPKRFPGIIRSLDREQLLEAANRYLIPEAAVEVTAGPCDA